jgi:hypothetical protein
MTLEIDDKFDKTLEQLRRRYGMDSKAAVIRRAVALLVVASDTRHSDGSIHLMTARGVTLRILVSDGDSCNSGSADGQHVPR